MSFNTLGLQDSLLRAVHGVGYTHPTPIQAQSIPAILSGKDVMAAAQTGTGKTAGFTLPLLQLLGAGERAASNQARALVLVPTRELAAQVEDSVRTYGSHENLRSVVVFGGVKINPQLMNMRKGADILVATPGRLLDLYSQNAVRFDNLEILVLDEADRMLDMGFIHDIRRILKLLPKQRQNLMFSATFSDEIRTLAKTICHKPVEIDVAPRNSTVDTITQKVYHVTKNDKFALLSTLLRTNTDQTLVFSRTKHGANALVKKLHRDGVSAAAIHGNKSQNQRTKALDDFKANRTQVLVATDIAARGIDIDDLAQVINFDLPNVSEDYVHRIGRTGRAGASGKALSLVSPEEKTLLRDIERLIKRKIDVAELPAFTVSDKAVLEDRPEKSENREQSVNDSQPAKRRRTRSSASKANSSSAAAGSGQQRQRRATTGNREGDNQEARPKRRRRSRGKSQNSQGKNTQGNHHAGNGNRQESASAAPGKRPSTIAKLKGFFTGRKVA